MSGRHVRTHRAPWIVGILAGGTALGLSAVLIIAGVQGTGAFAADDAGSTHRIPQSTAPSSGFAGKFQDPVPTTELQNKAGVVATHIEIPAIGVSTDLESLAVDSSGILHPPTDFDKAGWFSGGVLPGQVGPAVIAGHIDSAVRPAVFEHLPELVPGNTISVSLSDGTSVSFVVASSSLVSKAAFPTAEVYGSAPTPQLRLITCDGPFDRSTGHYTDNLVVFATLLPSHP